jgi:hypothetical protein
MQLLRSSGSAFDTSRCIDMSHMVDPHRFSVAYTKPILGDAMCDAKQIYRFDILTYTLVEIDLGVVIRLLVIIFGS